METTNPKDTVKERPDEVGLCPRAQELTSRPPQVHEGHGVDTAFETYVSALGGCNKLTSITVQGSGSPPRTRWDPWGHPQQ